MKRVLQVVSVMFILALLLLFSGHDAQVKEAAGQREFVISIVGDIMLSRNVQSALDKNGYDYPYEEVSPYFLKDDLTIGNLECPITDAGNAANKEKRFIFRADYENAAALSRAGFDCLNLANNHSMDYLGTGLGVVDPGSGHVRHRRLGADACRPGRSGGVSQQPLRLGTHLYGDPDPGEAL